MKESIIKVRNFFNGILYKWIFKPIFFTIDPEKIHDFFTIAGEFLGSNILTKSITSLFFSYQNKKLEQTINEIKFKNPIGLAAGFDKDAKMAGIMPSVGFGFVEVGSITGEPCEGNPKPRLWRLKKSEGLVVYYGLKNEGCEKIAEKLKKKNCKFPLGISIAKTNNKETADTQKGIADYIKAFKILKNHGNYITLNISCPNAYGGLPFTSKEKLEKLLTEIDKEIKRGDTPEKPIFLKLPPDLKDNELDDIIKVADRHKINGFICTNLTKDRENEDMKKHLTDVDPTAQGGISGKPIKELSTKVIKKLYKKTNGKYTIIGCGGVFTAEDAYEKIKAGASLLQLITGMIFKGPQVISEINQGLAELLEKDGYKNISEAIGADHKS